MLDKIMGLFAGTRPPHGVTVEKIRQIFAYGLKYNVKGISLSESEVSGLARLMDLQHGPNDLTIRVACKSFEVGQKVLIPPHIKWSNNPEFAYVGIVDDAVEFRYGTDKSSAWYLCPVASSSADRRKVEDLFQFWYERLALPGSLNETPDFTGMSIASDPFPGFSVLSLRYPNHSESGQDVRAEELATRLSRAMDVDWFGKTPDISHFAVSELTSYGDDSDEYAFDFGPFDEAADDFTNRHTVVVRQTAGGGMMLLIQNAAKAPYGGIVKNLFEQIVPQHVADDDR